MFFSLKKSNLIISVITFLLFCSALSAAAYAFPQMPTNFYGYVYLGADSHNASIGTNITAKINNITYSSILTTYNEYTTNNFYSFNVPTDDSAVSGKDGAETGDNISLYVLDIYSNSSIFTGPGSSNLLDLYINRPPVLDSIDDITITETDTATITPSADDADSDTITYSTNNSNFTDNAGSFGWATGYDDAGVYTVRVTASDGAMSDYQDITVTVTNKNHAPVASDDTAITDEDIAKEITLSATDADGDNLIYAIVTHPTDGTVTISGTTATYTPTENYNGADSFTFKANDGTADSNTATITITVTSVNDAPTISSPVTDITTPEDIEATLDLTQFENDVEDSDTSLTWSISEVNTAIFTAEIDEGTDVLTITPVTNANGVDTVTLTLTDSDGATATQDITVTISVVNDAPIAEDGSATTAEDTAKAITLTATDADGDSLTYALVTGPTDGAVSISGATATYIPNNNYYGEDSFTFNANDGTVNSTAKTISITVTAVNDAPVATSESVSTAEDTAVTMTLNATDIEGSSLTYSIVSDPTHGTLSGTAPSVTYTPNANYNGEDTFTFNVNDGTVNSTIAATISISVTAVNDAPQLDAISDISVFERQKIIMRPNATDVDEDSLTFTANNSNLKWNETSSAFEWTPEYLDSGNYTIIITVSDTALEDTQTFNIEVKDKYYAFDRDLALGWNLVSFPYVLDSASIDDVLSSIDGNYNVVWSENISSTSFEWASYDPSIPSFESNSLKTLENVQGFWINMTASDTLTVIGTIPTSTTINLNQGWNLISYPFDDSAEISCMLSQVAGNYTILWQYNETAPGADYEKWTLNNPAAPSQVNTLDNFTKGYGYWINMTEVETLEWTSTC